MDADNKRLKEANRITWIGFIVNALLTLLKFLAGFFGNSRAMIADGVHSLSDLVSDLVVLIGLKAGSKPIDDTHDYGHGKYETLCTLILALMIFAAGCGILYSGIQALMANAGGMPIKKPSWIAAAAAVLSLIVKEILFQMTIRVGKRLNSDITVANAWHHRSDAFSSIATTLGIFGALVLNEKWRILDPLAAIVVSIFIIKVAYKFFKDSINELLEKSLNPELEDKIVMLVSEVGGVVNPHDLKTRKIGNAIAIDIHIEVHPDMGIVEAHNIATVVEERIKDNFGQDTFISIHMEPNYKETDEK